MTSELDYIDFFDELLCRANRAEEIIIESAQHWGCSVGWVREGKGIASDSVGQALDPTPPAGAHQLGAPSGGLVWVSGLRAANPRALLKRLGIALAISAHWRPIGAASAPTALEVLIDPQTEPGERAEALSRLALSEHAQIRIVVCGGPAEAVERFSNHLNVNGNVLGLAHSGNKTLFLMNAEFEPLSIPGVPIGVKAGYSAHFPAESAITAHTNAVDAYRLAVPSEREHGPYSQLSGVWRDGSTLHSVAALCRLSMEEITRIPDVHVLERLRQQHGEHILSLLEAFATTDSLRRAASGLYMHHNTVNYWVQKAQTELGYSLADPYGRVALFIGLCLHHLWLTAEND